MADYLFLFASYASRGLGVRGRSNPQLGEREKSDALQTMRILKKHLRIENDNDRLTESRESIGGQS